MRSACLHSVEGIRCWRTFPKESSSVFWEMNSAHRSYKPLLLNDAYKNIKTENMIETTFMSSSKNVKDIKEMKWKKSSDHLLAENALKIPRDYAHKTCPIWLKGLSVNLLNSTNAKRVWVGCISLHEIGDLWFKKETLIP
jgi:hypothetical protein